MTKGMQPLLLLYPAAKETRKLVTFTLIKNKIC